MSRKQRIITVAFGAFFALLSVIAIGVFSPKNKQTYVVGFQSNLIYLPIFVAEANGYFREFGLDVELRKFQSASEMMRSLKLQEINFTGMSSMSVVAREQEATPGLLKVITLEKFSPNASPDAIVALHNAGINDLDGLKGKTLATWKGSTIKTYTKVIIESVGLNVHDLDIIDVGKVEMLELFKLGKVDAVFTFEPYVTQIVTHNNGIIVERAPLANRLLGSAKDIYPGGSAVLSSFEKNESEAVKSFKAAYAKAIKYIHTNRDDAIDILARRTSVPGSILKNMGKMDWVVADSIHLGAVQELLDLYSKHGITEKPLDASTVLSY
ncbi:MAG: ABC transporter substrate-binding protein [Candidatus Thiodiazotropha sp.]